jgi:hypothetical protein
VKWRSIRVRDHPSINIHDTLNPEKGLTSPRIDGVLPFIRLPRLQSLLIMGQVGQDKIFGALESCEKLRRTSLVRGDRKRIFGDHGKPVWYTCAGVQVSRNSPNVLDAAPSMDALPMNDWLCLMRIMRWAENCFEYIADHEAVSHIRAAKALLDFKTMNIPADESITPAKYFGGIGFGCNVYLRCHTDEDFTMSVIQVHLKGRTKYELDDEPVVFFCFPSLGVAVPLRPGDFLVFNPLIPHCISSRCRQSDDVMSLSMFLKSSVVGLNNNQLALTEEQCDLAKSYHSIALHQPNLPQRQRKALKRYHKFYTQL